MFVVVKLADCAMATVQYKNKSDRMAVFRFKVFSFKPHGSFAKGGFNKRQFVAKIIPSFELNGILTGIGKKIKVYPAGAFLIHH